MLLHKLIVVASFFAASALRPPQCAAPLLAPAQDATSQRRARDTREQADGSRSSRVPQRSRASATQSDSAQQLGRVARKAVGVALLGAISISSIPALAVEPSAASLELVQSALAASSAQRSDAVPLLTTAISAWQREKLPDDELAGLLKLRADCYAREGSSDSAEKDLASEIKLLEGNTQADPAELPRALLARARLAAARGAWAPAKTDAAKALELDEDLPPLEQRNPFAFELVARSAAKTADFPTAADYYGLAEKAHDRIGDAIRARNAGADRALALYRGRAETVLSSILPLRRLRGTAAACQRRKNHRKRSSPCRARSRHRYASDDATAAAESRRVFAQKSRPVSNNPDDVPLLQELSRKDAELHLALGARLAKSGADRDASALWETGCVRLRTYVDDATARIVADDAKDMSKEDLAGAARKFAAISSGLDPQNPYARRPRRSLDLVAAAPPRRRGSDRGDAPNRIAATPRRRRGSDDAAAPTRIVCRTAAPLIRSRNRRTRGSSGTNWRPTARAPPTRTTRPRETPR